MSEDSSAPLEDFSSDLAAFQSVAAAFQQLDHVGRIRLMRTIATFFKLDASTLTREAMLTGSDVSRLASTAAAFSEDRTQSPKDFLRDKKPRTDVERVATLAYYLTHYRNMPHFKTVDLSQLNTEAAQVKFSNAAQAVDNATKAGLLVPAVKGAKQLSADGESYVQSLPDRAAAKEAIADSRPRRKRRSHPGYGGGRSTSDSSEE